MKFSINGFNNNLLLIGEGPLKYKCENEGIPFIFVQNKLLNKEVINFINHENFHIVNFHGARAVLFNLINGKEISAKTIVTVHSDFNMDFSNKGMKSFMFTYLFKFGLKKFKRFICVSDYIKQLLIKENFTKDAYIVPNGIDLNKLIVKKSREELISELKIEKDDFIFIIVARLHPIKNHKSLLISFEKLIKKYNNSRLLIVGDGELRSELESLTKELSIEKFVYFLGFIDNPVDYINASDVSMINSFSEGGIPPLSILESLGVGVPCISSEFKGLKEVFNDSLIYVNPKDNESIFKAMIFAYENKNQIMSLSKKARAIATEKFSIKSFVENYYEAYYSILNEAYSNK